MNKVITINLNGRAYQLEEDGYQVLQAYLQAAEQKLNDDPDKREIMSDLEQAISEKLERFLRTGKNVVSKHEAEEVLKEMGPVEGETQAGEQSAGQSGQQTHKRLYRIREGAMFAGVCAGLAAYFNIDVTLVRVIFVILAILTHGFWLLAYFIMMIVVPHADTAQQQAAAYGMPFTAQEWVNRARNEYKKFAESGQWQENKEQWKKWKQEMKQHKHEMKQQYKQMHYQSRYSHSPFFGVLTAVISILWVAGLITLISSGMVYGFTLPSSIPLWIGILGWIAIYGVVMSPLKAARWSYTYNSTDGQHHHHHDDGFLEGIAWMAMVVIIFWAIYHFVPNSHQYYDKVGLWFQHIWNRVTNR